MANSEEDVLAAMADLIRAESANPDPRLERLARDELTEAETAQLYEDAARDPELARQVQLHAPMPDRVKERLYEVAAAGLRPRRPRRWWWTGAGSLALAAAAASFFLMMASPASLPEYVFKAQGQDVMFRGAAGEAGASRTLRADSKLALILRPKVKVDDVQGRLFVMANGVIRASSVVPEHSPDGAFRWRGTAEELTGLPAGEATLVAVVARPGSLPLSRELAAKSNRGPGWQAAAVHVLIRPIAAPVD